MNQSASASRPALSGIFLHVLAVAIGLAASSVLAQSIISTTDGQTATEPPGNTTTTGQPLSDQGISGELMHTLLGLSMPNSNGNVPLPEVSDAYPAYMTTWKRQENPDPAWPVISAFQDHRTANGQNTDRTPDGHFLLARSDFQYSLQSDLRGFNPNLPEGRIPAGFMASYASVPIQVNDTGIVLGNMMHVEQDTSLGGPREYELGPSPARIPCHSMPPYRPITAVTVATSSASGKAQSPDRSSSAGKTRSLTSTAQSARSGMSPSPGPSARP